ncbi:MAG: sel1 repeat family protein, partial [Muribaculaceae bacterium]|nr:sel1 repeat family protein [Muribaculaceae bacterium]
MERIYLLIISSLVTILGVAQEYTVRSFEVVPTDLSAKTESRVDGNGQVCALIKVYAADGIAAVRGAVVGDVADAGMEKWVYLSPNATQMELVFDNHSPLHIVFDDYFYPYVSGKMTYVLKLNEVTASETQPVNVTAVRKKAIKAYEKEEYQTAYELFSSISGDKKASYYLGEMYYNGNGVERSDTEAVRWYRKAAKQGNADAQGNLGEMYEEGRGVKQSYAGARSSNRKAAEKRNYDAQRN